ncbi:MAG: phosphopantetheine-binding protein, partial [Verrucomicrobia bacterium]|nr:phosphopantetheine-binding protein [Verrucomicrobiota bacterium]
MKTFLALVQRQRALTGASLAVSPDIPSVAGSTNATTPTRTYHEPKAPKTDDAGPAPVAVPSSPSAEPLPIARILMEVVSEKTGYPTEMLNLEMGLDSDLGIDSIKRVEIMSALQHKLPGSPEIRPEQLGSLQTLQQVVTFLSRGAQESRVQSAESSAVADHEGDVGGQESAVSQALLRIVSDKTGYPVEMLNLEMGLDSDLGIDSIKRVEIMSALQNEVHGLPEIKPEDLGTFKTLQHVVRLLCANKPVAVTSKGPMVDAGLIAPVVADSTQTLERLVVRPAHMAVDASAVQIHLEPGAVVWLVDDGTDLARQIERELAVLGYQVSRKSLVALSTQETPERLGGLIVLATAGATHADPIAASFAVIQRAGPGLRRAAKAAGSVLVTVSRMDGRFGLQGLNGQSNPLSGGLAGITKTAQHEWPEVHCKAIDLDADSKDKGKAARSIVREIFLKGPVEIGLSDQERCTVNLQSMPFNGEVTRLQLNAGDVVVVSGGGRGVTAHTVIALAQACRPTLVLLGRSPVPEVEPDWLLPLTDASAIKRAIHSHLNEPSSVQVVESHYRRWMGIREVTANIRR